MSTDSISEFSNEVTTLASTNFVIHDEVQLSRKPQHVITMLHGIRDRGGWALDLEYYSNSYGMQIAIAPISYGWLGAFPFLLRIGARKIEAQVREEMEQIYNSHPTAVHSLIAHSNGTKIASCAINSISFNYDNIVFCGSVCKRNDAPTSPSNADFVVNDCSPVDIWPLIAYIINPFSYEATGTYGFRRIGIKDRFFSVRHGGCISVDHFAKYILPMLMSGVMKLGERPRSAIPYFLPEYARVLLLLLLAGAIYLYIF